MRTAILRYAPRAVGLKPSAMRGEARLRGLYRIIYSKSILARTSESRPTMVAHVFSPTATQGGRRIGSASVTRRFNLYENRHNAQPYIKATITLLPSRLRQRHTSGRLQPQCL